MEIEEVNTTVTKQKCIKPAMFVDEPTGEVELINILDKTGNIVQREKPVKIRKFVEATYREVTDTITNFCVTVENETHEFSTRKDARQFIKETMKRG